MVQLYIDKPLLLRGNRKFDMRLWVLLDHKYHVHLYRQGVLRTGSTPFSMDDLGDRYVHLSNHCIQKNHPLYGKYEPTNEMWYHEFTLYLQEAYGVDFEDEIMPQVRSQSTRVAALSLTPPLLSPRPFADSRADSAGTGGSERRLGAA